MSGFVLCFLVSTCDLLSRLDTSCVAPSPLVSSFPVICHPVSSPCHILCRPCFVLSRPVSPCVVLSHLVLVYRPVSSCVVLSRPVLSCHVLYYPCHALQAPSSLVLSTLKFQRQRLFKEKRLLQRQHLDNIQLLRDATECMYV